MLTRPLLAAGRSVIAAIYLGPDGAAYIATLAGLVRIEDGTP